MGELMDGEWIQWMDGWMYSMNLSWTAFFYQNK